MISKWADLKPLAIEMRKQGRSLKDVAKTLQIPVSTLSGWFKSIELTEEQEERLRNNWLNTLAEHRGKAVLWHNEQKRQRLEEAEIKAETTLKRIHTEDKAALTLALAMLYLGEGHKTDRTGLGNSDPLILKFFLSCLERLYDYDIAQVRCDLHLRADQDPDEIKKYWSAELSIPLENFKGVSLDQRTSGKATYPAYKGVCVLSCGNLAIQRELVYLSQKFCSRIVNQ